ncbi:MAG: RNA polymerase sigma factor [Bacteroidales bacterium]
MKASHNDHNLIPQLINEETRYKAFEDLVKQYSKRLYYHIRRIVLRHEDADEVLQLTFIKAWENIAKFRGESKIFTWLFRIATNEALSFIKQSKRLQQLSSEEADIVLQQLAATDTHFNPNNIQLLFEQALLTLPPKQRVVFQMRYYEETPYEEMAEVLKTSVGALKASYHVAAQKIESFLRSK